METQEAPAQEETRALTAADRCDQCGAQAYAWALLENGELLFCAHHWAQYKDKILPMAVKSLDETDRLYQ